MPPFWHLQQLTLQLTKIFLLSLKKGVMVGFRLDGYSLGLCAQKQFYEKFVNIVGEILSALNECY